VNFRHPVSAEDLEPDAVPRVLFVDRQNGRTVRYQRPHVRGSRVTLAADGIEKSIAIEGDRLSVEYQLDSGAAPLQTEINLAMPSCDGFLGRYVIEGEVPGGFGQSFTWKGVTRVALEDRVLHGRVVLECSQPVTVSAAAHRTVSQSEDGFEKIMQAVTLNVVLDVAPAGTYSLTLLSETLLD